MQETPVWSLGQEDLLEEEMATHSNILAWKILWTKEPGRLQSMWLRRVQHDWTTEHACMHVWPLRDDELVGCKWFLLLIIFSHTYSLSGCSGQNNPPFDEISCCSYPDWRGTWKFPEVLVALAKQCCMKCFWFDVGSVQRYSRTQREIKHQATNKEHLKKTNLFIWLHWS